MEKSASANDVTPRTVSGVRLSKESRVFTDEEDQVSLKRTSCLPSKHGGQLWIRLLVYLFLVSIFFLGLATRRYQGDRSTEQYLETSIPRSKAFKLMTRRGYRFVEASNPNLRFVGRWSTTYPGQRRDASFPGAYLEFVVHNTSSLFLSLHNSFENPLARSGRANASSDIEIRKLDLRSNERRTETAAPVSLVVLIDQHEAVVHPRTAAGIVEIANDSLNSSRNNHIRVVYSCHASQLRSSFQFEGLWLDARGNLSHVENSTGSIMGDQGFKHSEGRYPRDNSRSRFHRKTIETVTDSLSFLRQNYTFEHTSPREIVQDMASWDSLLARTFDADYVTVPVDGLCLVDSGNGGSTSNVSIADTFFRSGPLGTPLFHRPWNFRSYAPDVLILDTGTTDFFFSHSLPASHSATTAAFISAYISFIQSIRRLAYPGDSQSYSTQSPSYVTNSAPSTLPIFILRPLSGAFESETLAVARKLRAEGDTRIFWVDTGGWVEWPTSFSFPSFSSSSNDDETEGGKDVVWSTAPNPPRYVLTPLGHAKVADYLGLHLCRHLAPRPSEECEFLGHEAGYALPDLKQPPPPSQRERKVERLLEESRMEKIRDMFFRNG